MTEPFDRYLEKTKEPLVSVIIPSYNKAEYLRESVGSILSQNYRNLEILIVNDGSPDNTSEIAGKIISENKDRKIVLHEKPNGGISDARNYGIERASGRIILTLDADDKAENPFIGSGIELMRFRFCNLISSDVELFGAEKGEWVPKEYDAFQIRYNNSIPSLAMYDREMWERAGGYKRAFAFNEDWDFFVSLQRYDLRVGLVREKLFKYRVTEGGLANNYIKDSWRRSVSLIMISNDTFYPVDEVLAAHENVSQMPKNWIERMEAQDKLHSNEWLLKFWLGLVAEKEGRPDVAFSLYQRAAQLTLGKNWQPMLRIAMHFERRGETEHAQGAYHMVRVARADMAHIISDKLKDLSGEG